MTRHQRRKAARAKRAAAERKAIVVRNLSTPVERVRERGTLVSTVYNGEGGRARGTGVVPMSHRVSCVFARRPEVAALLYPPGTKIIRQR